MSNISDDTIKKLSTEVQALKTECLSHVDQGHHNKAIECLDQIKTRHGQAIKCLHSLASTADIDNIKLSNSSCLIDLIKISLEKCITKIYNHSSGSKNNSAGPVTISIDVVSTDVPTVANTEVPTEIKQTGGYRANIMPQMEFSQMSDASENSMFINADSNLTEYIDQLRTSDAKKLFSTDSKITVDVLNTIKNTQSGGSADTDILNPSHPTLINFWVDNCGHSTRYLESWAKIRDALKLSHPSLQVIDVNASKFPGMTEKLRDFGINGYPTTVLFLDPNTKQHVKIVGNLPFDEVMSKIKTAVGSQ